MFFACPTLLGRVIDWCLIVSNWLFKLHSNCNDASNFNGKQTAGDHLGGRSRSCQEQQFVSQFVWPYSPSPTTGPFDIRECVKATEGEGEKKETRSQAVREACGRLSDVSSIVHSGIDGHLQAPLWWWKWLQSHQSLLLWNVPLPVKLSCLYCWKKKSRRVLSI